MSEKKAGNFEHATAMTVNAKAVQARPLIAKGGCVQLGAYVDLCHGRESLECSIDRITRIRCGTG